MKPAKENEMPVQLAGDEGSKEYPTVPGAKTPTTEHSKVISLNDVGGEDDRGEQPEIGKGAMTTHELLYDSYTPSEQQQVALATQFLLKHSDIGDKKHLTGHKCIFKVLMVLQWLLLVYGFIMLGLCAYMVMTGMGEFVLIGCALLSAALLALAFIGFWPAQEYSRKGIYCYTAMLFLFLAAEIAVIVLAFVTNFVEEYAKIWWDESDKKSRQNIEALLECCGYEGYEISKGQDSVSTVCTDGLEKTAPGCFEAIKGFISGNTIFLVIMGFIMLTQIGALVAACHFAGHLRRSVSYTSSDKYKSSDRNLEGVLTYVNYVQPPEGKPGG